MRQQAAPSSDARERILTAAYDLFLQRGVRAVGVNELISTAGVAKATFYAHFPSKEDLVLAFLERRREHFTEGYFAAELERRGGTPRERLLMIFTILDEWFHQPEYAGCPYIRGMLEAGEDSTVGQASISYLQEVRSAILCAARDMNLTDPEEFASSWVLLVQGSIISSMAIDRKSARRAAAIASHVIDLHTPANTEQ